ncbi:MAG: ribonuclease D [Acidobacteriota bacterium]
MTSKTSQNSSPRTERPYQWVATPDHLERAVADLTSETLVAVDTESDSFHHYRERVCLIQISTSENDYIIDPLALTDLSVMRDLFADPGREWIINGADYDVVCLKRDFNIHFGRIFDTVVAAQLLGYPATGLAAMLKRHFGLKVSKTYQRDEWFRRPLAPDQIQYALTDTRYLIRLRTILKKALERAGRLAWAEEEFAALVLREWTREPFEPEDFWKIKGAGKLSPREQVILRELAVMRDRRARQANRPPFKVTSDAVLLALARLKPTRPEALRNVRGLSPLMIRRMGRELLEAVGRGLTAEEPPPPSRARARARRPQHDPGAGRRLELLREWRKHKAAELSLDTGVLTPLSTLQAVARANPKTIEEMARIPNLSRWRVREFGANWIKVIGAVR